MGRSLAVIALIWWWEAFAFFLGQPLGIFERQSLQVCSFLNKTHLFLFQNTLCTYQLHLSCIDVLVVQLIQLEIVNRISFTYYWGNVYIWKKEGLK